LITGEAEEYGEAIFADPMYPWTRTEQLRGAVEWGDPHGQPGEVYTYCDTGYILLGEIIERTTGRPLAEVVGELVGYERLGLTSTWPLPQPSTRAKARGSTSSSSIVRLELSLKCGRRRGPERMD